MQLSSYSVVSTYFLVTIVHLASSHPLTTISSGSQIPPLPFPADQDITTCDFTPTTKSPTQPWHGASLYPTDDNNSNLADNQTLPFPPPSPPPQTLALSSKTRRHDTAICTTIAAFTFTHIATSHGQTRTRRLTLPSGLYVLSFTSDRLIHAVVENREYTASHRRTAVLHQFGAMRGTAVVRLREVAVVGFGFGWVPGLGQWGSGEVALFRIGLG